MIFTNNQDIYEKLLSIRIHGYDKNDKYNNIRLGINGRLDTIQAAVLLCKLEIFDNEIKRRNEIAKRYYENLKDYVVPPFKRQNHISAWAQYSILSDKRDSIIKNLKKYDIPTAIYYPKPLHMQGVFSYLNHKPEEFPISLKISKEIFSLPFHPYLTNDDIDFISEKIIEITK